MQGGVTVSMGVSVGPHGVGIFARRSSARAQSRGIGIDTRVWVRVGLGIGTTDNSTQNSTGAIVAGTSPITVMVQVGYSLIRVCRRMGSLELRMRLRLMLLGDMLTSLSISIVSRLGRMRRRMRGEVRGVKRDRRS